MGRLSYSRAQIDGFMLAVMSRRVPLSSGEGGAERRVRVCRMLALIRAFLEALPYRARASRGRPSPKGRRTRRPGFFRRLRAVIDRPYKLEIKIMRFFSGRRMRPAFPL